MIRSFESRQIFPYYIVSLGPFWLLAKREKARYEQMITKNKHG